MSKMITWVMAVLYLLLAGIFLNIASLLSIPFMRRRIYLSKIGRAIFYPFLQLLKIEIKIDRALPPNTPGIIVSNHQSNFDALIFLYALPENAITLGKRSIIFNPLFGLFYWITGNITLNRINKKSIYRALTQVSNFIKKNDSMVLIFPEGTRNLGKLKNFKKGAFYLAQKENIKIYPLYVSPYYPLHLSNNQKKEIVVKRLNTLSPHLFQSDEDIKNYAFQMISSLDCQVIQDN